MVSINTMVFEFLMATLLTAAFFIELRDKNSSLFWLVALSVFALTEWFMLINGIVHATT